MVGSLLPGHQSRADIDGVGGFANPVLLVDQGGYAPHWRPSLFVFIMYNVY